MLEKKSKKKINSNQKGKRVERELVNWLKEQNCPSARRTAQFNGKGDDALSDVVVPDELPSFHIESKGTTSAVLPKSILKKWAEQIKTDCPANLIPIIFHNANGKDLVCITLSKYYYPLGFKAAKLIPCTGDSFTPAEVLNNAQIEKNIYESVLINHIHDTAYPFVCAFQLAENTKVIAVLAKDMIIHMHMYEKAKKIIKAEKALDEHLIVPAQSVL